MGARLAIESDIHIADFPTVISCLTNLQPLPVELKNGLQVLSESANTAQPHLFLLLLLRLLALSIL